MTNEEVFAEFSNQVRARKEMLNREDCPPDYAFEEYQEGWRAAFHWSIDILAKIIK